MIEWKRFMNLKQINKNEKGKRENKNKWGIENINKKHPETHATYKNKYENRNKQNRNGPQITMRRRTNKRRTREQADKWTPDARCDTKHVRQNNPWSR